MMRHISSAWLRSPWWRHCTDQTALLSLITIALLLKIIILLEHPILARDGILHVKFAHDLVEKPWASTLREHPFHPGYAFTLAVASNVFQIFDPGALTPDEWQWCAHLSTSLAGILLIIPLYGLARSFYSMRTAWLGSLLFLLLPAVVQITTDALTESWYLLFMLTALWTLVQGVRSQRSSWFVMTGLLTGAAYLVRVEAVLIPAALLLWMFFDRWKQRLPVPSGCSVRNLIILSACFFLPPLPYMVTIGKLSNRPVVQIIVENQSEPQPIAQLDFLLASERLQYGVNGLHIDSVHWYQAIVLVIKTLGSAGLYVLWPLAAAGFIALWRSRRNDPALMLIMGLCLIYLAMLVRLAWTAGYASERHTLLFVALAAQAAAIGLITTSQWLRRTVFEGRSLGHFVSLALCLGFAAICLPKAVQPLHRSQEAHRQAGHWLSEHFHYNNDLLIDPYTWASFYSGLSFKPKTTNTDSGFTMGIIDPKDNDLNRQHDWKAARLLSQRASTVWSWPEHGNPRLIIKKVQDDGNGLGSTFNYE